MIKHRLVLCFPATLVEQPLIYHLVKDYDLMVNILRADINPRKEGRLVLEIDDSVGQQALFAVRDQVDDRLGIARALKDAAALFELFAKLVGVREIPVVCDRK